MGTAFRAGAVLLLFAALAGALLFVDREQPRRASAELPRPSVAAEAPEPPDSFSSPELAALTPARAATPPAGSGAGVAESESTLAAEPPEVEPVLEAGESAGSVAGANASAQDPANVAAREDPSTVVQNAEPRLASAHGRAEESGAAEGPAGEIGAQSAGSTLTLASRDVDRVPGAAEIGTQQKRIDRLLRDAQRALEEDRLTLPGDDNAYKYYREVLEVAPQHAEARLGIERIAERYIALIEHALATGRLDRAARYAARGLRVSPDNRKLLDLQQEVQARSLRRALQSHRAVRGGRDDAR